MVITCHIIIDVPNKSLQQNCICDGMVVCPPSTVFEYASQMSVGFRIAKLIRFFARELGLRFLADMFAIYVFDQSEFEKDASRRLFRYMHFAQFVSGSTEFELHIQKKDFPENCKSAFLFRLCEIFA